MNLSEATETTDQMEPVREICSQGIKKGNRTGDICWEEKRKKMKLSISINFFIYVIFVGVVPECVTTQLRMRGSILIM